MLISSICSKIKITLTLLVYSSKVTAVQAVSMLERKITSCKKRYRNIIKYRDLLIVLPMREPSTFRGIAVSLLRPVIGSNVEIDVVALNWCSRTQTICRRCTNISLQVQQYLLKIRLLQSSSSSCIIGKP